MAIFTTTPDVSGLLPEDYGALMVQPVEQASIAMQVTTVIATDANTFRAPVVTDDGDAAGTPRVRTSQATAQRSMNLE
jgi:hypothetical protein